MTMRERALKALVMDIHKESKKQPYCKIWYPGCYSSNVYFVCDGARILKCSYLEEYPIPSAFADGIEEFDYAAYWKRYINADRIRISLPSEKDLIEAQRAYNDLKKILREKFEYRGTRKNCLRFFWHYGDSAIYYRADWILKAIKAMKTPKAFLIKNGKWPILYIMCESQGTELFILPANKKNLEVIRLYRCPGFEVF